MSFRNLASSTMTMLLLSSASVIAAPEIKIITSNDPALVLGTFTADGGRTIKATVGIGSAAYRRKDAPEGRFVTLSDRGANIACGDVEDILGVKSDKLCKDAKNGRVYPFPSYSPTIYKLQVEGSSFRIVDQLPLKDQAGKALTGMPNKLTVATTETPLDGNGEKLEQRAGDVDAEGIVELQDGSFWITDENAPSVLHVAADGKVLVRYVPAGSEKDFEGAGYPVEGLLPAILAKRQANRGIESIAISPDERFIYFVLQSPLANPDAKTYQNARNARLFKLDRAAKRLDGQYVYTMTAMAEFKGEQDKNANTARVSELLALAEDHLLILDRTDKTTKIFSIDLAGATNILGSSWDNPTQLPSLEQVTLDVAAIKPVTKRLVFDTTTFPDLPTKIEGMAFFADGDLMLINDDDFGIEGKRTTIGKIVGLDLAR